MIDYYTNKASIEDIKEHLEDNSNEFVPPLESYVDIDSYSKKINKKCFTFEIWKKDKLIGLIAAYLNEYDKSVFITNFSIDKKYQKKNLGSELLDYCIKFCKKKQISIILLEVFDVNYKAIRFYEKQGFKVQKQIKNKLVMNMKTKRNYNEELKDTSDHKYAYNFDFDVMHPFMIKSFKPFFRDGNLLELGSFKGDFTKRLKSYFDRITCVEASDEAIKLAKKELGNHIVFKNALFEEVNLTEKYDNIVLTHVLEHLDDPVMVLKRINNEWLSEKGRLYLVCPNANAPSRQIAVKMGLISHNSAVTPAEKKHGHNITYTLDTLEREAKLAGLKVIHRSGIFFKALANFQWDRLLQTDIISEAYLNGCFDLGQQYPDLCSSIFLVCEKGNEKGK